MKTDKEIAEMRAKVQTMLVDLPMSTSETLGPEAVGVITALDWVLGKNLGFMSSFVANCEKAIREDI